MTSATRIYLNTVHGDRAGRVHIAIGSGPYVSDTGKYKHKQWTEHNFEWPVKRDPY